MIHSIYRNLKLNFPCHGFIVPRLALGGILVPEKSSFIVSVFRLRENPAVDENLKWTLMWLFNSADKIFFMSARSSVGILIIQVRTLDYFNFVCYALF